MPKLFAVGAQQILILGETFNYGSYHEGCAMFSRPDDYRGGFYVCILFQFKVFLYTSFYKIKVIPLPPP